MKIKFTLLLFFLTIIASFGQNVTQNFTPKLKGVTHVNCMHVQADGRIIIAGDFVESHGIPTNGIARFNPDGSLDNTFTFKYNSTGIIYDIEEQADGKLIFAGDVNTTELNYIFRLNNDGSKDEEFNAEFYYDLITEIELQSNGKIICLFGYHNKVVRINSDGSPDEDFTSDNIGSSSYGLHMRDLIVLTNDKILVAGLDHTNTGGLIRLNENGTVDNTFNVGTGADAAIYAIEVQSDSKIYAVGEFSNFSGIQTKGLIRLNEDGSIDNTFSISASINDYFSNSIEDLIVNKYGEIFLVGYDNNRYNLIKLDDSGNFDFTMKTGSINKIPEIEYPNKHLSLCLKNDSTLLIGGIISSYNNESLIGLAPIDFDGDIVEFNPKLRGKSIIKTVCKQNDGKLIFGGLFVETDSISTYKIARLNEDGSVDQAFQNNLEKIEGDIRDICQQSDNKIIIAGRLNLNGPSLQGIFGMIRLNEDGTIDTEFTPHLSLFQYYDGVDKVLNITNQLIIIGGFNKVNGINKKGLARINYDGNLDETFNTANILDFEYYDLDLKVMPNNNMMLIGALSSGGGFIYRLTENGDIDTEFNPEMSFNHLTPKSIEITPKGDILIAAENYDIFDNTIRPIYHLNYDGKYIDSTSFFFHKYPKNLAAINDSVVIAFGNHNQINYDTHYHISRLNLSSKVIDFQPINNSSISNANDLLIDSDSTILICGTFNKIRNNNLNGVARLTLENMLPTIKSVEILDSIPEDSIISLKLIDLIIEDDNLFPDDFNITIGNGDNYSLSNDTIMPNKDFYGEISIPIKVYDGYDMSDVYNYKLKIYPVNDAPVILGEAHSISTIKNQNIELSISDLNIADPDNVEDDFLITIYEGDNYTFEGTSITPENDYLGNLSVPISVNDGLSESEIYNLTISVNSATELQNINEQFTVDLFPNPTKGILTFQINTNRDYSNILLNIYNLDGRIVNSKKLLSNKIDISELANGVYIFEILINEESQKIKIIKQ